MRIPQFTRTVLPDRSVGGAAIQVARAPFEQKAQTAGQLQQAVRQGEGIATEYMLREAQARNATAVNEGVISYKRDLTEKADEGRRLRQARPQDFHKDFDKEMEKLADDYVKRMPSEAARAAFRESSSRVRVSFYDDNLRWERRRNVEQFGASVERSAQDLSAIAFRRGQDLQIAADSDKAVNDLYRDADASSIAGSTFVAPEKVQQINETMQKTVDTGFLLGVMDKNPSLALELIESGKFDKNLTAEELFSYKNRVKSAGRVDVIDELEDVDTARKMGLKIEPEKLSGLIARAEMFGMEKQAKSLREFAAMQPELNRFATQPFLEQRQEMEVLKRSVEGGNLADADKYAAFAQVLSNKQDMVQKGDALAYYAAHDVVREPQPIDFSDVNSIKEELDRRRISAQRIREIDGIQVPLFTPAEIQSLKGVYETSDAKQTTALLTSMSQAMNGQEIAAVSRSVAPSSSTLAVAMAVGDPLVAERIVEGSKLKGEVPQGDIRAEVHSLVGNAVSDAGKFEAVQDSIYSYYKSLSLLAGDSSANVNDDRLEQAVQDILGPVIEIGDGKVLSYKNRATGQWREESFVKDLLTGLPDEIISEFGNPVGTTGAKYKAEDLYRSGRFISDGDGMYAVVDAFGDVVKNEDGSTFRIDARRLEEMSYKRRGGTFSVFVGGQ